MTQLLPCPASFGDARRMIYVIAILCLMSALAVGAQALSDRKLGPAHPGSGNIKPVPGVSVSIVANQLGIMSERSRIVIIRAGLPIIIGANSEKAAWSQPVKSGDVVLCNQPAEDLIQWMQDHPSQQITPAEIATVCKSETAWIDIPPLSSPSEDVQLPNRNPEAELQPPGSNQSALAKANVHKVAPSTKPASGNDNLISSTPWSIIVILIVAACGLLWLLLRRRS